MALGFVYILLLIGKVTGNIEIHIVVLTIKLYDRLLCIQVISIQEVLKGSDKRLQHETCLPLFIVSQLTNVETCRLLAT